MHLFPLKNIFTDLRFHLHLLTQLSHLCIPRRLDAARFLHVISLIVCESSIVHTSSTETNTTMSPYFHWSAQPAHPFSYYVQKLTSKFISSLQVNACLFLSRPMYTSKKARVTLRYWGFQASKNHYRPGAVSNEFCYSIKPASHLNEPLDFSWLHRYQTCSTLSAGDFDLKVQLLRI